ncbi:hypothetical protein CDAR_115371 [Caerostris darwini]|uniref:Uncharacterized protein n=1 Tax=Caerostris darwini TaxID=1538125 RepID=A0AAV4U9Y0_9ARAC|nr:hypothetical protein CDAR_115371 [Caerostris darwini]
MGEKKQVSNHRPNFPVAVKKVFCNVFTGCGSRSSKRTAELGTSESFDRRSKRSISYNPKSFSELINDLLDPNYIENIYENDKENYNNVIPFLTDLSEEKQIQEELNPMS